MLCPLQHCLLGFLAAKRVGKAHQRPWQQFSLRSSKGGGESSPTSKSHQQLQASWLLHILQQGCWLLLSTGWESKGMGREQDYRAVLNSLTSSSTRNTLWCIPPCAPTGCLHTARVAAAGTRGSPWHCHGSVGAWGHLPWEKLWVTAADTDRRTSTLRAPHPALQRVGRGR